MNSQTCILCKTTRLIYCDRANRPTVFLRIHNLFTWIQSILHTCGNSKMPLEFS